MGIYRKNNKWWVDYYVNGERYRKPISHRKTDAEKVWIKIQSDKLNKKYALPIDEKIKFSEFAKKYIEDYSIPKKKSYDSDISKIKHLVTYFGDLYLHEITYYHFEQYRNIRRKQKAIKKDTLISTSTINREVALLRGILNRAVKWQFLSVNPLQRLEMYKEEPKERILNTGEMRRLILDAGEPLKYIILVALNTGMRRGEILNLEWNQVNIEKGFITVKKTKTNKLRRIPLNRPMKDLFSKLHLMRGGSDFVFTNPKTGKPFVNITRAWLKLVKKTGIKDVRFHDLRHCFATYTLLNGGDLISLKETLGHADIQTTSRYTKALMEGQQKLVNCFEIAEDGGEVIDFPERKVKTS